MRLAAKEKLGKRAFLGSKRGRGGQDAFRHPQGLKVERLRVWLPKVGWVKFPKSQEICGEIRNATVSKRAGLWDIAIQVELEWEKPVHPKADQAVGSEFGDDERRRCGDWGAEP